MSLINILSTSRAEASSQSVHTNKRFYIVIQLQLSLLAVVASILKQDRKSERKILQNVLNS